MTATNLCCALKHFCTAVRSTPCSAAASTSKYNVVIHAKQAHAGFKYGRPATSSKHNSPHPLGNAKRHVSTTAASGRRQLLYPPHFALLVLGR